MPRIEGYRFGHVRIDGEEQTRDVCSPIGGARNGHRLLADWTDAS